MDDGSSSLTSVLIKRVLGHSARHGALKLLMFRARRARNIKDFSLFGIHVSLEARLRLLACMVARHGCTTMHVLKQARMQKRIAFRGGFACWLPVKISLERMWEVEHGTKSSKLQSRLCEWLYPGRSLPQSGIQSPGCSVHRKDVSGRYAGDRRRSTPQKNDPANAVGVSGRWHQAWRIMRSLVREAAWLSVVGVCTLLHSNSLALRRCKLPQHRTVKKELLELRTRT